jgi:hypothetical protein
VRGREEADHGAGGDALDGSAQRGSERVLEGLASLVLARSVRRS